MLAAIKYAVAKGILVVEAAGNGGENLDAQMYDQPKDGFPPNWSNPFRRQENDSGAILVGAGTPPKGTHGRNHGPERSRLDFSNYGSAIDAQGWGREVTTAGYGDLSRSSGENSSYTDQFSGTSRASPIVAGALAYLQSIHLTRGGRQLPYATVRELLRTTGSLQQDAPGRPASQRIGNLPDLRALISLLNEF
ncbi:S8 family serine peptidase [Paenibacillus sp. JJ1722]|uniref:S8 family serine peptidase n=1 Tax=Paenibacillus sp. JJ1722 TaxID=3398770 RepID=UPI003AAC9FA1